MTDQQIEVAKILIRDITRAPNVAGRASAVDTYCAFMVAVREGEPESRNAPLKERDYYVPPMRIFNPVPQPSSIPDVDTLSESLYNAYGASLSSCVHWSDLTDAHRATWRMVAQKAVDCLT